MKVEMPEDLVTKFHTDPNPNKLHKGKKWTLAAPFPVIIQGIPIEIPVGFWTDFASIPSVLWTFLDPYDLGRSPVVHDFLYLGGLNTREWCDAVFLAGMETEKIAAWRMKSAYAAVRGFGWSTWNTYRKNNTRYKLAFERSSYNLKGWNRKV